MPTASERCSCGATIELTAAYDTRLQAGLEEWRKSHRHAFPPPPPIQPPPFVPYPPWPGVTSVTTTTKRSDP